MGILETIATIVTIIVSIITAFYLVIKIIPEEFRVAITKKLEGLMGQLKKNPWVLGIFLVIIIISVVIGFLYQDHPDYIIDDELKHIFPQIAEEIPLTYTTTWATNGRVNSEFHDDIILEGREYHTKITFQNFFPEVDSNSGWIISRLKGYNASEFEYISFWVKGESGGEKFGIKMKDTRGTETKVIIMEHVGKKGIAKDWQRVIVPLSKFRQVDRSSLYCISLYTDGNLSGATDPMTIYVADFKLY